MKAIARDRYGSPDVLALRDIDGPSAEDGHVLVRVHAAAVSIGDWLTTRGLPYFSRAQYGLRRPKHAVPGFEFAGHVDAVGAKVTRFHEGDAVFGAGTQALAEYVSVPEEQLAHKPAALSFEQAAVVPISGSAALQALRDAGRFRSGQRVLIIGASGGVGTFAVQIAKAFGAEVTGVCSTRNVDLVHSIGADHVIDYTKKDIAADTARHDLVLDIAGNRPISVLRKTLASNGTLVIVGGSGGPWFMGFGRTIGALALSPFVSQRLRPFFSKTTSEDLLVLMELIEDGKVAPVIDRTYPLGEAREAVRYVGQRHTRGKTVVNVWDGSEQGTKAPAGRARAGARR